MNYSDIIALARAGFTAQQIAQMSQVEPVYQPTPAPVPASPQEPTPESVPPEPVQQEPTPAPAQQSPDQFVAILAEMQTLKQTIQSQNRQNAELIPPAPQSAQDILASIIAPPKRDGDK